MGDTFVITKLHCGPQYGQWRCEAGTSLIRKAQDYEFIWVRNGKARCSVGKTVHRVGTDHIVLLRPGQVAKWKCEGTDPCLAFVFGFNASCIPESWPRQARWPFGRKMQAHDVLRPLFEYVVRHGDQCEDKIGPALASAVEMMLAAFISGTVNQERAPSPSLPPPVQRVVQWLAEFMILTPAQKVTLGDLAMVSGVCSTHLCRLFHEHVGKGPLELLYLIRITRALIGLGKGQKIESLAYQLGFTNASHFARRFKAFFGKTPGQMQKAMARGYKPKTPKLPLMS